MYRLTNFPTPFIANWVSKGALKAARVPRKPPFWLTTFRLAFSDTFLLLSLCSTFLWRLKPVKRLFDSLTLPRTTFKHTSHSPFSSSLVAAFNTFFLSPALLLAILLKNVFVTAKRADFIFTPLRLSTNCLSYCLNWPINNLTLSIENIRSHTLFVIRFRLQINQQIAMRLLRCILKGFQQKFVLPGIHLPR